MPALPAGMFNWITGVIERLGYLGIAPLTLLENIGQSLAKR